MSNDLNECTSSDDYEIVRKISNGKHADLFEGIRITDFTRCILKPAKQVGRDRIEQEINILQSLRGGVNIILLYDIIRYGPLELPSLALEYVENIDFRCLYPTFNSDDIRYYIKELLKALQFSHGKNIMHRDIRPHNIRIDPIQRKLRLLGWDYAEVYVPSSLYSVRVGSVNRAPELLLSHEMYDFSVDMWSLGVMFASVVFRKEPFFHGASISDQLRRIARVLGTKGLLNVVEKYDMDATPYGFDDIPYFEKTPLQSLFNESNERNASIEVTDLLDKLLRWDPAERVTANDAIRHAYFQ
ncbi:kinase-like domain-containing protein [Trichoderma evansii]